VLTIVALAATTVTDIRWFNSGERAAERRTLRAFGWPPHGVALLAVGEVVRLGLVGGVAASVLDVVGVLAVVRRVPADLLPVVAVVVGTGVAMTLLAASLPAVARVQRASGRITSDDHAMTTR